MTFSSSSSSRIKVAIGVLVGMGIAGLPLLNKTVYEREQQVHRMRDDQYDLKDSARNSRLQRSSSTGSQRN